MIVLLSCYELGHAPHSIALALGLFERAKISASAQDLSVERLNLSQLAAARLIAISTPMHTAMRLGVSLLPLLKRHAPQARIAFFGLYATLNEAHLFASGVDFVLSGESEEALLSLSRQLLYGGEAEARVSTPERHTPPILEKLSFVAPAREKLPPLERYARLSIDGAQRLAGYTEASRGCLHLCTHCPIPAVYKGRFFVVPKEIVLRDIEAQVARGAEHITFGDPDFLNGPTHSLALARELPRRFPGLTFDFTAKVEHLLAHQAKLPELVECGAVFAVSAFESLSDEVLRRLQKGHTREQIKALLPIARAAGLVLRPTWVPFTPWSTFDDLCELFALAADEELVGQIDPIQYTIRLLIPPGSLLLQDESLQGRLAPLDAKSLVYPWHHQDPALDQLARSLAEVVSQTPEATPIEHTFSTLRQLTQRAAKRAQDPPLHKRQALAPRLTEAWFC